MSGLSWEYSILVTKLRFHEWYINYFGTYKWILINSKTAKWGLKIASHADVLRGSSRVAAPPSAREASLKLLLASTSKGLFTCSGGPRSSGVGFFCFHALGDTKQKKPTPLDRGPPLHVNRV